MTAPKQMSVLAHRGCHGAVPENTLAAFAAAAESGADGIETDVRISAEGLAVLVHDRVLPSGRTVAASTRSDIEAALGHPVTTLEEALTSFPNLLWNLELKTLDAIGPTIDALRTRPVPRLVVTSFRHDAVAAFAEVTEVQCGLLVAERPLDLATLLGSARRYPRLRTVVWEYGALDAALVSGTHRAGWRNWCYGAITDDEHAHCAALGLDAVITDRIDLGLKHA